MVHFEPKIKKNIWGGAQHRAQAPPRMPPPWRLQPLHKILNMPLLICYNIMQNHERWKEQQPWTAVAAGADQDRTECHDWSQTGARRPTFPPPGIRLREYPHGAWLQTGMTPFPSTRCSRKTIHAHFNEFLSSCWKDYWLNVYTLQYHTDRICQKNFMTKVKSCVCVCVKSCNSIQLQLLLLQCNME